jgi:hypothetical protein
MGVDKLGQVDKTGRGMELQWNLTNNGLESEETKQLLTIVHRRFKSSPGHQFTDPIKTTSRPPNTRWGLLSGVLYAPFFTSRGPEKVPKMEHEWNLNGT